MRRRQSVPGGRISTALDLLRLQAELESVETLEPKRLETLMRLFNWEGIHLRPDRPALEAAYLKIMRAYAKTLPVANTVEDLFQLGILRVDPSGLVVTDYYLRGTRLELLTLSAGEYGMRISGNRASGHFTGGGQDFESALGSAGAGMKDAMAAPSSPETAVVIGVPMRWVRKTGGNEEMITVPQLGSTDGVGVFRLPRYVPGELKDYCRVHGCRIRGSLDW